MGPRLRGDDVVSLPQIYFHSPVGISHSHSSCNEQDPVRMLYALLCYNNEDTVFSWTKEEDDAVMAQLHVVHDKLAKQGKLGPAIRLLPTTAATTLHKNQDPPLVIDGPYAETKE